MQLQSRRSSAAHRRGAQADAARAGGAAGGLRKWKGVLASDTGALALRFKLYDHRFRVKVDTTEAAVLAQVNREVAQWVMKPGSASVRIQVAG